MKNLLRVFLCLLIVDFSVSLNKKTIKLPPETANALVAAVQQCMASSGVPVESLLQVYQGGYSEDKKFKSFIYCCYKTTGYLKPDNHMDVEKMVKLFNKEPEVVDGVRRCGQETGQNAKEAVFNFFKCFQDTVPVKFSL